MVINHFTPVITTTLTYTTDVPSDSAGESHFVPKSIFISHYPKESDQTMKQLDDLTRYLMEHNYTVYYDKYCATQIQSCGGIDIWKEVHIRKAETILVICTPAYYEDDERALMKGEISKIAVDRKLLRSIAYSNKCDRLIPVLLDEYKNVRHCIPTFVQPFAPHFWPSKKQDLMFSIAKMAKFELPKIPDYEKIVLKPIVIKVPRRKELPKPTQVQPDREEKDQKSKIIHPHEKKVLKSTVIQMPRRKEVSQAQPQSNVIQSTKQKELPTVESQPPTKKHFRPFSKLKKALKSK